MADGIDDVAGEEVGGFNFDKAESLSFGVGDSEQVDSADDQVLEGDVETTDDIAKLQARSIVGVMDMSFGFLGAEKYSDSVYSEGERHISPAIVRLNFRLPALEFINAALWLGFRIIKSVKEVKQGSGGDDAVQEHQKTEQ